MPDTIDIPALMEDIKDRTAPMRRRKRRIQVAQALANAQMGRKDAITEITHAAGGKEKPPEQEAFAEKDVGPIIGKEFVPDTLRQSLMTRAFARAAADEATWLTQLHQTVTEGMLGGAGDIKSLTGRVSSLFRGLVADGSVDPATGEKLLKPWKAEEAARTTAAGAYNAGRLDIILDPDADVVEGVEFSAIIDDRSSKICPPWDGTRIRKENEALIQELNPPLHPRCRSMFIPITEFDEWEETPPDQYPTTTNKDGKTVVVQPAKGFGVLPIEEAA